MNNIPQPVWILFYIFVAVILNALVSVFVYSFIATYSLTEYFKRKEEYIDKAHLKDEDVETIKEVFNARVGRRPC